MIRSTNTIDIDGTVLKEEEIAGVFRFDKDDTFSRWVVRPVAALTAIGLGVAMLFASVFFMLLSLAVMPLLAVAFWVFRTKIRRDLRDADPVVHTQGASAEEPSGSVQAKA